jgi:hypothetical protein
MDIKIHIHDHYVLEGGHEFKNEEALKESIKNWLINLIQAFINDEDNFVLDDLKHIYVANEYVKELYAFQAEKDLPQGHTNNDLGEGHAMVLHYENDAAEEEAAIFFRAEFIFGLYTSCSFGDELKSEVTMLFNTFFHELSHINDEYHTRKVISIKDIDECSILPRNLYPISLGMWKEYYAYRKAAIRFPYGDLQISHLFDTLNWILEEVSKLKTKFKEDNDMDNFMLQFTSKMGYLLRVVVSVIGNVQGYSTEQDDQEETFKIVSESFPNGILSEVFTGLIKELDKLYEKYPSWSGINEIDELNNLVLECFNEFGVFPSEIDSDDQMYIGIDK